MKQLKPVIDEMRLRAIHVNIVHLKGDRAFEFISEMEAEYAKPFSNGREMATTIKASIALEKTFSTIVQYMELTGWFIADTTSVNLFLSNNPHSLKLLLEGLGHGRGEMEAARVSAYSLLDEYIRENDAKVQAT